jgi:type IV pilus assembly protein PilV
MAIVRQLNDEAGVAMIEALIAIVIISFGLLGLAGLQLAGVRTNQVAYYRSVATTQAYDMADRMRANMAGVNGGSYNAISVSIPARPSCSNPFVVGVGCAPAVMATYDAYAWLTENARLLPGGSGTVTRQANSNAFDIIVQWTEKCSPGEASCSAAGNLTRSFTTRFVP